MLQSTVKDQIRLFQMFASNDLEGAKLKIKQFPNILKETVAEGKHVLQNPLYAAIGLAPRNTPVNKEAIDFLLTSNPDLVNHVCYRQAILGYTVANREDPELVQRLIDLGANVNDQSKYDDMNWKIYKPTYSTAAHIAAQTGKDKSLAVLIKNKADLNLQNKGGVTPMDVYFYNADKVSPIVAKMIAEAGGDVSIPVNGSSTSIGYGINLKAWEGVTECLKHTKAMLTKFQLDKIVKGAIEGNKLNLKAVEAVFYALKHMPADFENAAYLKSLAKMPEYNDACKALVDGLTHENLPTSTFNVEDYAHHLSVAVTDFELAAPIDHSTFADVI